MGASLSGHRENESPPRYFLLVGPSESGKRTLLFRLGLEELLKQPPVFPDRPKEIRLRHGLKLLMWDSMPGENHERLLLQLPDIKAVLFVFDATDSSSVDEAARTLPDFLNEPKLQHALFLVLANKEDKPHQDLEGLKAALSLTATDGQRIRMQGCSALTGDGLDDGLNWLTENLNGLRLEKTWWDSFGELFSPPGHAL